MGSKQRVIHAVLSMRTMKRAVTSASRWEVLQGKMLRLSWGMAVLFFITTGTQIAAHELLLSTASDMSIYTHDCRSAHAGPCMLPVHVMEGVSGMTGQYYRWGYPPIFSNGSLPIESKWPFSSAYGVGNTSSNVSVLVNEWVNRVYEGASVRIPREGPSLTHQNSQQVDTNIADNAKNAVFHVQSSGIDRVGPAARQLQVAVDARTPRLTNFHFPFDDLNTLAVANALRIVTTVCTALSIALLIMYYQDLYEWRQLKGYIHPGATWWEARANSALLAEILFCALHIPPYFEEIAAKYAIPKSVSSGRWMPSDRYSAGYLQAVVGVYLALLLVPISRAVLSVRIIFWSSALSSPAGSFILSFIKSPLSLRLVVKALVKARPIRTALPLATSIIFVVAYCIRNIDTLSCIALPAAYACEPTNFAGALWTVATTFTTLGFGSPYRPYTPGSKLITVLGGFMYLVHTFVMASYIWKWIRLQPREAMVTDLLARQEHRHAMREAAVEAVFGYWRYRRSLARSMTWSKGLGLKKVVSAGAGANGGLASPSSPTNRPPAATAIHHPAAHPAPLTATVSPSSAKVSMFTFRENGAVAAPHSTRCPSFKLAWCLLCCQPSTRVCPRSRDACCWSRSMPPSPNDADTSPASSGKSWSTNAAKKSFVQKRVGRQDQPESILVSMRNLNIATSPRSELAKKAKVQEANQKFKQINVSPPIRKDSTGKSTVLAAPSFPRRDVGMEEASRGSPTLSLSKQSKGSITSERSIPEEPQNSHLPGMVTPPQDGLSSVVISPSGVVFPHRPPLPVNHSSIRRGLPSVGHVDSLGKGAGIAEHAMMPMQRTSPSMSPQNFTEGVPQAAPIRHPPPFAAQTQDHPFDVDPGGVAAAALHPRTARALVFDQDYSAGRGVDLRRHSFGGRAVPTIQQSFTPDTSGESAFAPATQRAKPALRVDVPIVTSPAASNKSGTSDDAPPARGHGRRASTGTMPTVPVVNASAPRKRLDEPLVESGTAPLLAAVLAGRQRQQEEAAVSIRRRQSGMVTDMEVSRVPKSLQVALAMQGADVDLRSPSNKAGLSLASIVRANAGLADDSKYDHDDLPTTVWEWVIYVLCSSACRRRIRVRVMRSVRSVCNSRLRVVVRPLSEKLLPEKIAVHSLAAWIQAKRDAQRVALDVDPTNAKINHASVLSTHVELLQEKVDKLLKSLVPPKRQESIRAEIEARLSARSAPQAAPPSGRSSFLGSLGKKRRKADGVTSARLPSTNDASLSKDVPSAKLSQLRSASHSAGPVPTALQEDPKMVQGSERVHVDTGSMLSALDDEPLPSSAVSMRKIARVPVPLMLGTVAEETPDLGLVCQQLRALSEQLQHLS